MRRRVIGGLAAYLYLEELNQTRDALPEISISPLRRRIWRETSGRSSRSACNIGMSLVWTGLVRTEEPSVRRAVHLITTPELGTYRTSKGIRLVPLGDMVRMKLTRLRAKDEAHLKDLDEAGLINAGLEAISHLSCAKGWHKFAHGHSGIG